MQSESTITSKWPDGAVPAQQVADLLGISMAGLRLAVKTAAPPMARLQPWSPMLWPVVEAVLLELGFAKKTAAGGLEGLADFNVQDFLEKARGGAVAKQDEAATTPATPPVVPDEKLAPWPQMVQATLVAQCPNPLFWRAKVMVEGHARMVTVKEPVAHKRARFRPGLAVKVWPMAFPQDHFTTVAPKGDA